MASLRRVIGGLKACFAGHAWNESWTMNCAHSWRPPSKRKMRAGMSREKAIALHEWNWAASRP